MRGSILAVTLLTTLLVASTSATATLANNCQFAPAFASTLVGNATAEAAVLQLIMQAESHFVQPGVAYDANTGMTYDGHLLDFVTGLPAQPQSQYLHNFSAASKEAIHVALLALALQGSSDDNTALARTLLGNVSSVVDVLSRKMDTYQRWLAEQPTFAGLLPWYVILPNGSLIPSQGWDHTVPGLDNGEWLWAMRAVAVAAQALVATNTLPSALSQQVATIATRYEAHFWTLVNNSVTVFYNGPGTGLVRSVAVIIPNATTNTTRYIVDCMCAEGKELKPTPPRSPHVPPTPASYQTRMQAGVPLCNCFLDDPYEGELMTVLIYLYGNLPQADRELIWVNKRQYLAPANISVPISDEDMQTINTQRGWWFSAHEQWKQLELPYYLSPTNNAVFVAGEKARTWWSAVSEIGGLFASVNDVCTPAQGQPTCFSPDYDGGTGIAPLAFLPIDSTNVVTPYGAMNVILANRTIGLEWYLNTLLASKMQGPLGSSEAVSVTGNQMTPLTTWDAKMTSCLAMLGGVGWLNEQALTADGVLSDFTAVVEKEWSLVFPDALSAPSVPWVVPSTTIPAMLPAFTACLD